MSDVPPPDPDRLLRELRAAAGEPPLTPLHLADATPSDRPGAIGRAVGAVRRAVLRLIAPALGDLLTQLERDRHRQRQEIERLAARVEALEADRADERA